VFPSTVQKIRDEPGGERVEAGAEHLSINFGPRVGPHTVNAAVGRALDLQNQAS
jgi:hypothetical protein